MEQLIEMTKLYIAPIFSFLQTTRQRINNKFTTFTCSSSDSYVQTSTSTLTKQSFYIRAAAFYEIL